MTHASATDMKDIGHISMSEYESNNVGNDHVVTFQATKSRVNAELKKLGMKHWGFMQLGTHYLPTLIHGDEHLEAIVYGHNKEGSVMMVATDSRIIYLDKDLMFAHAEDITYDVVAGVSYSTVGVSALVTLHTRLGDFTIRTMNWTCAKNFRDFIDERCLQHKVGNEHPLLANWSHAR